MYLGLRVVSALSSGKQTAQISVNDRVSVFLELAEAHRVLGEQVRACMHTATLLRNPSASTLGG